MTLPYRFYQFLPFVNIFLHLFQITDLQQSVLSPLSFRLEYKRGATTTPTMFQRQVRMQVNINDITEAGQDNSDGGGSSSRSSNGGSSTSVMPVHAITFTLLSGNDYFTNSRM